MTQLQQLINSFSNEDTIEYQSRQFDIDAAKTHLTAELSTLELLLAPQKLWIRNHIGVRRLFTFCSADRDADGDTVGFNYRSVAEGRPTITMLLIND